MVEVFRLVIKNLGSSSQRMSRSANPPPFLARSAHGRSSTRLVFKAARHFDIASCTCSTTTRPTPLPWPVSPVLPPFSLLEAFTWPLNWFTQFFSIFVRHSRVLTLPICHFVPPRHMHDIILPPRSSSLIDTVTSSLSSFGMSV